MKSLLIILFVLPVLIFSQINPKVLKNAEIETGKEISNDLKLTWLANQVVVENPDTTWVNEIDFLGEK
ncbi:MAG: hypothetical protein KDC05_14910, partial [Bacteroidales bacterium]|nr:hypothetical protein [Bacteroidales bacterium]